jgi:hypothetical protein
MSPILCLGNSHLAALRRAYEARSDAEGPLLRFVSINKEPFQPNLTDGVLHPNLRKHLSPNDTSPLILMIGGNHHNVLGLVNHPTRFDFFLDEDPNLVAVTGAEIIPLGLVRAQLDQMLVKPVKDILAAIAATAASRPVFQMESPPPIADADHIRQFPGIFADKISRRGVAPDILRYKLWRVHSALMREYCDALNITFVPVPAAMQDDRGMLAKAAWSADPVHANEIYGHHLIAQISELVSADHKAIRDAS